MSPQIPAILFILVIASAIRGNLLARSLWLKGHFLFEGRASFRKIRRALAAAQTEPDKRAILRFRSWYILHVILFWIALAAAFYTVFSAHH
jgi:hypothetical protein